MSAATTNAAPTPPSATPGTSPAATQTAAAPITHATIDGHEAEPRRRRLPAQLLAVCGGGHAVSLDPPPPGASSGSGDLAGVGS